MLKPRHMLRLVVLILTMALASTASAKVWNWFEIEADEYYEYAITEYDVYSGHLTKNESFALDFRKSEDTSGEVIFNVTTTTVQPINQTGLQEAIMWGALPTPLGLSR